MEPLEQQLVRQARAGDRKAFAALVDSYWPRLYRWLYGLTHNTHSAEELTQEVFLKAWSFLATFQGEVGFRVWLFRIASNALIDGRRGPRSAPARPLPETLASRDQGPVAAVLSQESQTLVADACARLPNHFRAPFLLRTQEDLSFTEIAHALGLTEETVRWRVFKARQLLMDELGPYLDRKRP